MLRISRHALLILLLGILLLPQLAAAAPQAAPANPSTSGNDTMLVRLKNGLTVYIIRDSRFPLVCTRLFVGTGSANETAEQAGISHVLEHMVFKGTEKRPKGQVARDVESLGGYLNAATSFDKTWFITDMPAKHWKTGMDVVKDMAFHPSLDPAELEAEKDVIVSDLKGGDDTPTRRLYNALVWGEPKEDSGTVDAPIYRDPRDKLRMAIAPDEIVGKRAVTHYRTLEDFGYATLVECRLETGRTHQIRVHMASLGHPLFNDARYGGDRILRGTTSGAYRQFIHHCFDACPRQALHARTLGFRHPDTGEEMDFEAPLPTDFSSLLDRWRALRQAVR